ncbi:MAG: SMI1/KNR4 family protein [Isosphaeraceae bacterium]
MAVRLGDQVRSWLASGGIDARLAPNPDALDSVFLNSQDACRREADPAAIAAWEGRHGYRLPTGLRAWLMLSNGLYRSGPLIHPLSAIGPMIPFARMPGMVVQPESWFELGNPNLQTICIDLGYRLPGAGNPIFTSGDDARNSPPRIIARSFEEWFIELLRQGGREYWFDPDFDDFGAPWPSHRHYATGPFLCDRLRPFVDRVWPLLLARADERDIAERLGLNRPDVELILRHLQHVRIIPAAEAPISRHDAALQVVGDSAPDAATSASKSARDPRITAASGNSGNDSRSGS